MPLVLQAYWWINHNIIFNHGDTEDTERKIVNHGDTEKEKNKKKGD
jgi:hypothetical protein